MIEITGYKDVHLFERGGVKSVVYLMDCMEGMKQIPDKYFDLAVVDPPYGANDAISLSNNNQNKKQSALRTQYKVFENDAPNDDYFIQLEVRSKHQIVWGGNFFGLIGGYLCWNKNGTAFGEAELAYMSMIKSVRIFEYTWNGMIQQDMKNKEHRIHPTQKPVALYEWIYKNYGQDCKNVLDTHLGSQSNRIAAFKAGIDFMGFELDEDYFRDGNKRFDNFISQFTLF